MILTLALSLFINLGVVSAAPQLLCLSNGQIIELSECNPNIDDYVCDGTLCQICVDENDGVYCQSNSCNDIGSCTYLNEPIDPEQPPEDLPEISLIGPDEDYYGEASTDIEFNFQVESSYKFESCELMIDGISVAEKTKPIGTSIQTLSYAPEEGEHDWRMKCILRENYGGWADSSDLRILTIGGAVTDSICGNGTIEGSEECDDGNVIDGDGCSAICEIEVEEPEVQTEVILTSPANGIVYTDTQVLNFVFSFNESVVLEDLVSCNLILNDIEIPNSSEILAENTISYSVSPASYNWSVDCLLSDESIISSILRTFTINSPAPVNNGNTGGGGGGGGGSCSTTWNCTTWSGCINETQARTCSKLKAYCSAPAKPEEERDCVIQLGEEGEDDELETQENTEDIEPGRLAGITGGVIGSIKNNKVRYALGFVVVIGIAGIVSYSNQKKKNE